MKLVVAVVQAQDGEALLRRLAEAGFGATRISSTGGFLREGNQTVFVGVEEVRLEEVLELIRETCRTRTRLVTPFPILREGGEFLPVPPVEVQVGGAVVFVLDVERYLRI